MCAKENCLQDHDEKITFFIEEAMKRHKTEDDAYYMVSIAELDFTSSIPSFSHNSLDMCIWNSIYSNDVLDEFCDELLEYACDIDAGDECEDIKEVQYLKLRTPEEEE